MKCRDSGGGLLSPSLSSRDKDIFEMKRTSSDVTW